LLPFSLNVNSDADVAANDRRFNLNANNTPDNVAPMALIYTQVTKSVA
jgi:hypothetical protein